MVEIKAGQWWTDKGSMAERHRILVRGLTRTGMVIVEWSDGKVSTLDLDYFLKFKEHLPECTSFDWVPEVYPQYRETFQPEEFAFVRLNDKNTFTYVRLDGKEDPPCRYGYAWETIDDRPKLTEAEALARIVKPKPKTRTVKVHTVEMSDRPQDRFISVGVNDEGLAVMRKNWKTVHVLKTEEFEVPCE